MAILIMLNNFFHDLSAAGWICSTWLHWKLRKEIAPTNKQMTKLFAYLLRFSVVSLGLNFLFGAIRALNYYQYEYLPAAGKGQIYALIIKHILLFSLVIAGGIFQWRFYREFKGTSGGK